MIGEVEVARSACPSPAAPHEPLAVVVEVGGEHLDGDNTLEFALGESKNCAETPTPDFDGTPELAATSSPSRWSRCVFDGATSSITRTPRCR